RILGKVLQSVAVSLMSDSYCWGVRSYWERSSPWIFPETGTSRLGRRGSAPAGWVGTIEASGRLIRVRPPLSFEYHRLTSFEVASLKVPMLAISIPIDRPLALVACQAPSL